ncbi:hypothetical protein EJ06DRAFT_488235 [Trichodelitschia bisporula]|uniref:Kinetochore protein SPC25 n=1 Tax=Trichodelitschia bisporula TaxID=703511 RepID=A0A6G1I5X4_9PEZI|nr:hypothetical protein EJ06DRAFT_488235 [Trichodelitschia bisporula]
MGTMFEPSLSTSGMRPHHPGAPSMADQLPSINFGFEDLRDRMSRFTVRFDEFIERGRKRVLEERNQFRINVAELQEDQRMRKRDIEIETLKAQSHAQALAKETAETAEMHAAIATLTTHHEGLTERRDALRSELKSLQTTLTARRDAQAKHTRYLHSQARFNVPEMQFWEDYLCLRIEGAGQEDRLKFIFSHICEREWEREAWFELDTSSHEYKVLKTYPKLEKDEVERCVEKLNEGRELAPFFKAMREVFVRAFK